MIAIPLNLRVWRLRRLLSRCEFETSLARLMLVKYGGRVPWTYPKGWEDDQRARLARYERHAERFAARAAKEIEKLGGVEVLS